MIIKKRLWNLHFGNKGIVFSIDAIAASIIVITILVVSYFYVLKASSDIPNLNVLRTGDDIITMMDYDGTLKSLNADTINNQMKLMLPVQYDMSIRVTSNNQNISIGNTPPNDRFVGGGKRFSVKINQDNATYITTRYWIWLK